ncbi:MAG: GNAT family N-acetyltransferase [Pseudomonadota bacterium]|nr:GNAT family N-acetyltransferase [Pseudomonadota bacterium]
MATIIRLFAAVDAAQWFEVHHSAVRETAAKDYSKSVIEAWAPSVEPAMIQYLIADHSGTKIVAEVDGEVVGIGEVALTNCELRACYVAPRFGRRGIGRALVAELETIARNGKIAALVLSSSLTAERFYRHLGYRVTAHGQHVLRNGEPMACVYMTKLLE